MNYIAVPDEVISRVDTDGLVNSGWHLECEGCERNEKGMRKVVKGMRKVVKGMRKVEEGIERLCLERNVIKI